MVRFSELDERSFDGAILIIDVDGTITNDKSMIVDADAERKLRALAARNRVYLCSNGPDKERVKAFAERTGTQYLESIHKKPSARLFKDIPDSAGKRLVVIGDKHLTDGRFAKNIGAEFIQTGRIRHTDDRFHIGMIYHMDDLYGHVARMAKPIMPYIRLMRPSQWIKNLLVFAPIFFADHVFELGFLREAFFAFVAFSSAASAVYVMNDMVDAAQDREHPIKRLRPIALRTVTSSSAAVLLVVLLGLTAAVLAFVPQAAPALLAYFVLNALYSFSLKHVAVIDVLCIAIFYILRIEAGGAATATRLSPWIILCVLFGALFLALGKRRAEFSHASRRKVIDSYSVLGLDHLLAASATLSVISYGLYSLIGSVSAYTVYSTIFVACAIFRVLNYIYMAKDGEAEFPEKLLFKDPWVVTCVVLWGIYMLGILYL